MQSRLREILKREGTKYGRVPKCTIFEAPSLLQRRAELFRAVEFHRPRLLMSALTFKPVPISDIVQLGL
jgi:hypothetical protein